MLVVVPPMTMGLTVESPAASVVLAPYDDFFDVSPAVSSPATAPATRRSSSAGEAEPVTGFTVGLGSAVAAPADEVSSAVATAAARPAAATGSPKRIRRL
ncbi:hypothetical protein GCM10010321_45910 [Streptomyces chartreusis]|nr:hypothetical protein GCM10010321_45910 [Streptomyces chartreusis]